LFISINNEVITIYLNSGFWRSQKKSVIHIATLEEYEQKLKEKLLEEVNEFLKENNEEELADVLEVIDAICDFKNVDKDKVKDLKEEKLNSRGSFKERIILDEVDHK